LMLAIELPDKGGPDLPLEVSAIDSFGSVTDAPERTLTIVARQGVSLARVFAGEQLLCDVLDRCLAVSRFLLEQAPAWGVWKRRPTSSAPATTRTASSPAIPSSPISAAASAVSASGEPVLSSTPWCPPSSNRRSKGSRPNAPTRASSVSSASLHRGRRRCCC